MKDNMKVLLTGANGQLGRSLRLTHDRLLHDMLDDRQFIYTSRHGGATEYGEYVYTLDIMDLDAVMKFIDDMDIDMVVNCAAYTNVDGAETNEEEAHAINTEGARNLAIAMKKRDGWLLHISTDYVFGNSSHAVPYKESDMTNPLGVYGKTKLDGEEAIQEIDCNYMIVRTSWLYSTFGHNFFKTMCGLIASKDCLEVVFDQTGTPTYAQDLADAIMKMMESPMKGLYHYSNEGVCSWYDFAVEIHNTLLPRKDCFITPCHSDRYPSVVHRPEYSVLDKTKIKETFGLRIRHWRDALTDCAAHYNEMALKKMD